MALKDQRTGGAARLPVGQTPTQGIFVDAKAEAKGERPSIPDLGKAPMAKVDVKTVDSVWKGRIGAAIQRAVLAVWETNQLAAAELKVDEGEFSRWLSGERRAHWDRLFAVERLREPLITELARLTGARVRTRIEWNRKVG